MEPSRPEPKLKLAARALTSLSPGKANLLAEVATVLFIAAIALTAARSGTGYILFPELGALAYDVMRRPHGVWARAPGMLILTPFFAGVLGTLVAQHMAYGPSSVSLTVLGTILIIRVLRSPIAPAISAGLLPLALTITSWWYPASLLVGLGTLALLSIGRRRLFPSPADAGTPSDLADDAVERTPRRYSWLPAYFLLLIVAAALAQATGWRLLLFPPLAVIGFEMFAHPRTCPWADRNLALILACTLTALFGLAMVDLLGAGPIGAGISILFGILLLRVLDLHVPPALAVGLLPFIVDRPDYELPLAVAAGTIVLSAGFAVWQRITPGGAAV